MSAVCAGGLARLCPGLLSGLGLYSLGGIGYDAEPTVIGG